MAVQFSSFSGGPHGLGPVVLPRQEHWLGQLGDVLSSAGNIPNQVSQMQQRHQLNQLLMQALTQPRSISQTQPGMDVPVNQLEEVDLNNPPVGFSTMAPGSVSDAFTRTPDTVKQVPNPEYEDVIGRLQDVGPAYKMDFYKGRLGGGRSVDDLIKLEMVRQLGRKELEGTKADAKKEVNEALYGEKAELEGIRARNRQRLVNVTYERKEKLQKQHDTVIERIKKDDRMSDEQKHRATLAERTRHNKEMEGINWELNDIRRENPASPNDTKIVTALERISDEMRNLDTQFARMAQMEPGANTSELLKANIDRYNNLGRQAQRLEPGYYFEEKKLEDVPWYKESGILPKAGSALGITPPSKQLSPGRPGTPPPRTEPLVPKQEPAPSRNQFKTTDEYLNARREWLKRQNQFSR